MTGNQEIKEVVYDRAGDELPQKSLGTFRVTLLGIIGNGSPEQLVNYLEKCRTEEI